MIKEN